MVHDPAKFQARRHKLRLTTGELADILGVRQRAVEAWEQSSARTSGARNPSSMVMRMMDYLASGELKVRKYDRNR